MKSYVHHVVIKVINLPARPLPEGIVVVLRPRVSIKRVHVTFAIPYCVGNRAKLRWIHGVNTT